MLCKRKPDAPQNEIYVDSYGVTNFQGEYKFVVGYKNTYFALVKTLYGNSPVQDNNVMLLVENTEKDKKYEFQFEIANTKPIISGTPAKAFDNEDYKLSFDYQATNQTNWLNYMDDLSNLRTYWSTDSKTGSAFMLLNELEYDNLKTAKPFNYADNDYFQCSDGIFDVRFQRWWYNYALFYNGYNSLNPMEIKVNAKLWRNPAASVQSETEAKFKVFPNPSSDYITITIGNKETPINNDLMIEIGNSLGKIIYSSFITNNQSIDISKFPAGIYFTKIFYQNEVSQSQFVVVK